MRKSARAANLLALSLLVGCTSGTPSATQSTTPSGNANAATFSGSAQGPGAIFGSGSSSSLVPVANTTLLVVDPATGKTVGTTTTDASGNYTASVTPSQIQGFHTQQAGQSDGEICVCIMHAPAAARATALKMMGVSCANVGSTSTGTDVTPGTTAAANALAQTVGLDQVPEDATNGATFANAMKAVKDTLSDINQTGRKFDGDPTFIKAADPSQALQAMNSIAANLAKQAADLLSGQGDQTANNVLLAFRGMMPKLKDQFVPGTGPDLDKMVQNLGGFVNNIKQRVQQELVSQLANRPFTLPAGIANKQFLVPPAPVRRFGLLRIQQAADTTLKAVFPSLQAIPVPPELQGSVTPSADPSGNSSTVSFAPPVALAAAYGGSTPTISQTVTVDTGTGTSTAKVSFTGFPSNIPAPRFPDITLTIMGKNSNPTVTFDVTITNTEGGTTKTTKASLEGQLNNTGQIITVAADKLTVSSGETSPGNPIGDLVLARQKGFPLQLRFNRQSGGGGAADLTGDWVVTETIPAGQALPSEITQAEAQNRPDFSRLIGALPAASTAVATGGLPAQPALPSGTITQALADQLASQYCAAVKQAAAQTPALTQQVVDTACNGYKQALQQFVK